MFQIERLKALQPLNEQGTLCSFSLQNFYI